MQVAASLGRGLRSIPYSAVACCGALAFGSLLPVNACAADNPLLIDPSLIASLRMRAQHAAPREQVQIYADLVDKISLLVSREIADGDDEKAQSTLHQLEDCAAILETGVQRDSKGLKRTEMLLHTTHRRLSDMVRNASGDLKPMVQSAVNRLDRVQTALLSAVFEH
ncbi:MAG: hypothetical protein ACRYF4_13575 [Janthinobacterium lividum]